MPIHLIIENEGSQQKVKITSKPLLLGRSSSCDLKLSDSQISGKHLQVLIGRDGKTIVKDLETTNGTFLNGSKIMESHLFLDDELTIGSIQIYLDSSEMTAKEKTIHTREGEKTQHTFVNLPSDGGNAVKKAMQKAKAKHEEIKPPPPKANFKNEDARQKEIMALLNKDGGGSSEEEKNSPGMRTRIINKAKEKVRKDKDPLVDEVRDGENFDLEESSGNTKFLKIDKPTKKGKK